MTEAALRGRLFVAVAVVAALGLLVDLGAWRSPDAAWAAVLWPVLSLSAEGNVPTWFVSSLLLACAARS